jgi:integrase
MLTKETIAMTARNHCPANERIKRRYMIRIRETKGKHHATIDSAAAAIARYEEFTKYRDFKRFHIEQVRVFKKYLTEDAVAVRSGKPLSAATIASTLRILRAFFLWLADQPGYRARIRYSDAEYFTPPGQTERIAAGRIERPGPELEDVHTLLDTMPVSTLLHQRDRALVALIALTAARDSAVISLRLKHLDLENFRLVQDAREVKTKGSKTFVTTFYPVKGNVLQIVTDWKNCLVSELGFGPDDPLFPATAMALDGNSQFVASGLGRKPWSTTEPVRKILKEAFKAASLHYHNPHSFRSTITRLGQRMCRSPEEFTAWSQNMGHSSVLTTFSAYGKVSDARQAEIIRNLGTNKTDGQDQTAIAAMEAFLAQMKAQGRTA